MEGDAFPLGQRTVIAQHTVGGAVGAKAHVQVRDLARGTGQIGFNAVQVALLGQHRKLVEVVAHIMPCLARFLNGRLQVLVLLTLHRQKVVFLL